MHKYHVTYFYLATGMEGIADTADYGYVFADSEQEAIDCIGYKLSPHESNETYRNWGLSARLVKADLSKIKDI